MLTGGDTFYTLTPEKDRPGALHLALAPEPVHLGQGEATAEMRVYAEGDTVFFETPLPDGQQITFALHAEALRRVLAELGQ